VGSISRAASKLRSASDKLRGVSDVSAIEGDATLNSVPTETLKKFADMAAAACTPICRRLVLSNMLAAGVKSDNIVAAVNKSYAVYWAKRGVVRFRLIAGLSFTHVRPDGSIQRDADRTGNTSKEAGAYATVASIDAGRVRGIPGGSAARVKRSIKNKWTKARLGEVRQKHFINGEWKEIVRGEIKEGSFRIVTARPFFKFSASQQKQIEAVFRKHFFGLVQRHRKNAR